MDTFSIVSLGNVDFLESVLQGVAMICGTGSFKQLCACGALIGLLFIGFQTVFQGAQRINLQHLLVCFICYVGFFGPSCRVTIEDAQTGYVKLVDNVPLGVGVAASGISQIGYGLMHLIEQGYGEVSRTSNFHYTEPLQILNRLRTATYGDELWAALDAECGAGCNTKQAVINYISECTMKGIKKGEITLSQIMDSKFTAGHKFDEFAWDSELHMTYLPLIEGGTIVGEGGMMTCKDAWPKIKTLVFNNVSKAGVAQRLNRMVNIRDYSTGSYVVPSNYNRVQSAFTALGFTTSTAQDYTMASMVVPVFSEAGLKFYTTEQDRASAISVSQALEQRRTQWAAEQSLFMTSSKAFIAFFEGFAYAITPIMGFLMLTGAFGLGLVGKYFMVIAWIQLWFPCMSICNLYTMTGARTELADAALDGASIYSLDQIYGRVAEWVSIGGMLFAATPVLAMFLVSGSMLAFNSIAGRLSGRDHFNEKIATPDAVQPAAAMNMAPGTTYNRTQGVFASGAEHFVPTYSLTQDASTLESSTRQEAMSWMKSHIGSMGDLSKSGASYAEQMSSVRSLGNAIQTSTNQSMSALRSWAEERLEANGVDKSFASQAIAAQALKANVSGNADLSRAVDVLNKEGMDGSVSKSGSASTTKGQTVSHSTGDTRETNDATTRVEDTTPKGVGNNGSDPAHTKGSSKPAVQTSNRSTESHKTSETAQNRAEDSRRTSRTKSAAKSASESVARSSNRGFRGGFGAGGSLDGEARNTDSTGKTETSSFKINTKDAFGGAENFSVASQNSVSEMLASSDSKTLSELASKEKVASLQDLYAKASSMQQAWASQRSVAHSMRSAISTNAVAMSNQIQTLNPGEFNRILRESSNPMLGNALPTINAKANSFARAINPSGPLSQEELSRGRVMAMIDHWRNTGNTKEFARAYAATLGVSNTAMSQDYGISGAGRTPGLQGEVAAGQSGAQQQITQTGKVVEAGKKKVAEDKKPLKTGGELADEGMEQLNKTNQAHRDEATRRELPRLLHEIGQKQFESGNGFGLKMNEMLMRKSGSDFMNWLTNLGKSRANRENPSFSFTGLSKGQTAFLDAYSQASFFTSEAVVRQASEGIRSEVRTALSKYQDGFNNLSREEQDKQVEKVSNDIVDRLVNSYDANTPAALGMITKFNDAVGINSGATMKFSANGGVEAMTGGRKVTPDTLPQGNFPLRDSLSSDKPVNQPNPQSGKRSASAASVTPSTSTTDGGKPFGMKVAKTVESGVAFLSGSRTGHTAPLSGSVSPSSAATSQPAEVSQDKAAKIAAQSKDGIVDMSKMSVGERIQESAMRYGAQLMAGPAVAAIRGVSEIANLMKSGGKSGSFSDAVGSFFGSSSAQAASQGSPNNAGAVDTSKAFSNLSSETRGDLSVGGSGKSVEQAKAVNATPVKTEDRPAKSLGSVSAKYESRASAGAVGRENNGFSYGTYQMHSGGTVQSFLKQSGYDKQFKGMQVGSSEFNQKWKDLAKNDKNFAQAQHDFIKASHYDKAMDRLKSNGVDLSGRGRAVQEAVFSTAVQFGAGNGRTGASGLIRAALSGKDLSKMSDKDIVSAIQDHKIANNDRFFRSSDASTRQAMLSRASSEKNDLVAMATQTQAKDSSLASRNAVPGSLNGNGYSITEEGAFAQSLANAGVAPAVSQRIDSALDAQAAGGTPFSIGGAISAFLNEGQTTGGDQAGEVPTGPAGIPDPAWYTPPSKGVASRSDAAFQEMLERRKSRLAEQEGGGSGGLNPFIKQNGNSGGSRGGRSGSRRRRR